ncbi:MAG: SLBB domain-containing protein [Prosthecobacter sp.]|uniref:M56 family metallopeptidase n=1 Tax=Prosthecobacter sp. TaxID=1965333 RepID=UPI002620067D|nr:M56 family metallopeptidase [Prosthecobacter sp.]MCF7789921.1 SLBB domain-containing protein [Prosthecobacter sp.]
MNIEHLLSSTPGWLLDVALQTTVLLALAGGATLCARRMAAARRHFILASALMLIPVVMGCSFVAPVWRISLGAMHTPQPAGGLQTTVALNYDHVPPTIASTVSVSVAQDDAPYSPLWALLWLGGICVGAMLLGVSAWTLRRLRAGSHKVVDPTMQRCFAEEAEALHLKLPEDSLRMSAACTVPMTWGISKRTVLLPIQAAEWEVSRLRLVLRHELAHIARGDVLITLLTTLSALLLWFHPLVWMMLRASARAREQACDDVALERSGVSADHFAAELLAAVAALGTTSRPWLPLALAMSVSANAKAMHQRLANLIHPDRSRQTYTPLQKLTLLLPAVVGAFGLAGLTACRKAEPVVPKQILVMSRFVSIPMDSPVLAEAGLTLDGNKSGLQSLGILNEEHANNLLRKLSQQKGVDLMSTPSVTTRSGQKATVEVVREFIYPTEFDPPRQATQTEPLIPTTPTAFEMKPVGVRMEVVPTLMENGSIDLTVTPEATSFEGFIDYGTPITQAGKVVSENKIQQPIFHTLKTTASFVMEPGQSVVFGGLGGPDATPLTSRMPKTKDLIFFIIQANTVEPGKPITISKDPVVPQPLTPSVVIYGQVKRQGAYPFKPNMTVQDLLDQAQGLTDRANATHAELKRGPQLAARTTLLDLTQDRSKPLEPGDSLTVPEK